MELESLQDRVLLESKLLKARPSLLRSLVMVPLMVAASLAAVAGVSRLNSRPEWPQAELLLLERRGEYVDLDTAVMSYLDGDTVAAGPAVSAVFCLNGYDWFYDRVLSTDIVLGSNQHLIRAAELYSEAVTAGELEVASLIVDIEYMKWVNGDHSTAEWIDGLDRATSEIALQYLEDRAQPPSHEALSRFIVYATNLTTSTQRLVFVDLARLTPETLSASSSSGAIGNVVLAGSPAGDPESLEVSDCDDVADNWDGFEPSLPSLPPITDRSRP